MARLNIGLDLGNSYSYILIKDLKKQKIFDPMFSDSMEKLSGITGSDFEENLNRFDNLGIPSYIFKCNNSIKVGYAALDEISRQNLRKISLKMAYSNTESSDLKMPYNGFSDIDEATQYFLQLFILYAIQSYSKYIGENLSFQDINYIRLGIPASWANDYDATCNDDDNYGGAYASEFYCNHLRFVMQEALNLSKSTLVRNKTTINGLDLDLEAKIILNNFQGKGTWWKNIKILLNYEPILGGYILTKNINTNKKFLVIDIGGGTTDFLLCQKDERGKFLPVIDKFDNVFAGKVNYAGYDLDAILMGNIKSYIKSCDADLNNQAQMIFDYNDFEKFKISLLTSNNDERTGVSLNASFFGYGKDKKIVISSRDSSGWKVIKITAKLEDNGIIALNSTTHDIKVSTNATVTYPIGAWVYDIRKYVEHFLKRAISLDIINKNENINVGFIGGASGYKYLQKDICERIEICQLTQLPLSRNEENQILHAIEKDNRGVEFMNSCSVAYGALQNEIPECLNVRYYFSPCTLKRRRGETFEKLLLRLENDGIHLPSVKIDYNSENKEGRKFLGPDQKQENPLILIFTLYNSLYQRLINKGYGIKYNKELQDFKFCLYSSAGLRFPRTSVYKISKNMTDSRVKECIYNISITNNLESEYPLAVNTKLDIELMESLRYLVLNENEEYGTIKSELERRNPSQKRFIKERREDDE